MMQGLTTIFGDSPAVTLIVVFVGLVVVLVLSGWLFRKIAGNGSVRMPRGRQPRLSITDAAIVDEKRRLVLVRRDNVEHLVLIGGPNDLVIEQQIVRVQAVAQREPAPGQEGVEAPHPRPAPAARQRERRGQFPAQEPALKAPQDLPAESDAFAHEVEHRPSTAQDEVPSGRSGTPGAPPPSVAPMRQYMEVPEQADRPETRTAAADRDAAPRVVERASAPAVPAQPAPGQTRNGAARPEVRTDPPERMVPDVSVQPARPERSRQADATQRPHAAAPQPQTGSERMHQPARTQPAMPAAAVAAGAVLGGATASAEAGIPAESPADPVIEFSFDEQILEELEREHASSMPDDLPMMDIEFDLAGELERDLASSLPAPPELAAQESAFSGTVAPEPAAAEPDLESALAAELGDDLDFSGLLNGDQVKQAGLSPEPRVEPAQAAKRSEIEDEMQKLLDELSSA